MLPNRIRISKSATEIFKQIKMKTGVTPNILARFALAASLESADTIRENPDELVGSEMNIGTLFGELRLHFEALLKQRYGELDSESCAACIASHIDQGALILRRAKSVSDIFDLVPMVL